MTDPTARDPALVELVALPTVASRVTMPMAELDLGKVFGTYPPQIAARLAEAGSAPVGPMFGRYHRFGPDKVDVEVGFPVAGPPPGIPALADVPAGEVGTSELPGGPAAVILHEGSYDDLPSVYDRLQAWIRDQGRQDGSGPWETYLSTPMDSPDPAELRTEVTWPLA